jgi:hypothetical protein
MRPTAIGNQRITMTGSATAGRTWRRPYREYYLAATGSPIRVRGGWRRPGGTNALHHTDDIWLEGPPAAANADVNAATNPTNVGANPFYLRKAGAQPALY